MTDIQDVEEFLTAYVREAVRVGVVLLAGSWGRPGGCHCLVSDLAWRGGAGDITHCGYFRGLQCRYAVAHMLGIPAVRVEGIINGWDDGDEGTNWICSAWAEMGYRVRLAYLAAMEARGPCA